MKTTIILMRHAEVKREIDDKGYGLIYGPDASIDFSAAQIQLSKTARELKGIEFDAFYTSDTLRARQSANIFLKQHGSEVPRLITANGLRSVYCPSWIGKRVDGAIGEDGYFPSIDEQSGDESFEDYSERVWSAFMGIVADNPGGTIGIMGHSEGVGHIMDRLHNPNGDNLRVEKSIPTGCAIKLEINPYNWSLEKEALIIPGHYGGKERR